MSGTRLIDLSEIDASTAEQVGGKAVGLGELIRAGFRVPAGFCLTTEAYRSGAVPVDELIAAHQRIGGGPVAVRSSATAEDLPDASFAGQQDTFLHVQGAEELVDAVHRCWRSLDTERAVAYRESNEIERGSAAMAVVVQRMVEPRTAGVLFTADPITGCRNRMVLDAVPGLGIGVVDGSADADHYVLDDATRGRPAGTGCLEAGEPAALQEIGRRVQEHFGAPQDIEWAIDRGGTPWVLQSRAITTLFPLPPQDGQLPRVYFEMGHVQGMLRPFTPAGMSALQLATGMWLGNYRIGGMMGIVGIGGRLFLDLTDLLRARWTRQRMPQMMEVYGPRCVRVVEKLLEDPRFAPDRRLPFRVLPVLRLVLRMLPGLVAGLVRALLEPGATREQAFRCTAEICRRSAAPGPMTSDDRLRFAAGVQREFLSPEALGGLMWPLFAGLIVSRLPRGLLRGLASDAECEEVLGGLPHNVTTEMDLALWQLAASLGEPERALLSGTAPEDLARMHHRGELPDIGLEEFLTRYGHRAAAEIDVGVPRWAEDPAPIFATLAGYLRITDPAQAPDHRFRQAAERAEAKIDELVERARPTRPVRARLARLFLRRSRQLTGLRELGKFAWLFPLAELRRQLLLVGEDLAGRGLLDQAGDIMFLELPEMRAAVRGTDHRSLVAERKSFHRKEMRRRQVPVALLSDGTDLEAADPPPDSGDGVLAGMSAAPGRATGRARVIRDPARARIEPGEILVAPTTDPGWTPLFMSVAGLVTETGSPMAHGPTVAREYGVPAVICVRGATERLSTGQLITVDGAAGSVTVQSESD